MDVLYQRYAESCFLYVRLAAIFTPCGMFLCARVKLRLNRANGWAS
jgi:hypothetical protein